MSSPRVRKIADRIQVIVAEMLERRIKDPRLANEHGNLVTVTDVRVSGDTQQATVFYTVMGVGIGDPPDLVATEAALASARGLIRSEVGKQLGMRHVPTIDFVHDALPESAKQIDDLLERVRRSDADVAAAAAGATFAGEPDPYRKPHEDDDEDDLEDDAAGE